MRELTVRAPNLSFEAPFPRLWFRENTFLTWLSDGINLTFPMGERCFVSAVRLHLAAIHDPELREHVRRFCSQEGQHARAHERFIAALRNQGFELEAFFTAFEPFISGMKARTPAMQLAITAAFEHYTATLAELALTPGLLDGVHEPLRRLIVWHSAEELEHRSVAFNVLGQVEGRRYLLRVAGFAVASAAVFHWSFVATRQFVVQSDTPLVTLWQDYRNARSLTEHSRFWSKLFAYLKPGFHPDATASDCLARAYRELEPLLGDRDQVRDDRGLEFRTVERG
jgi:predicted metal-dependent hydrolase